jgi:hypothetical protein
MRIGAVIRKYRVQRIDKMRRQCLARINFLEMAEEFGPSSSGSWISEDPESERTSSSSFSIAYNDAFLVQGLVRREF